MQKKQAFTVIGLTLAAGLGAVANNAFNNAVDASACSTHDWDCSTNLQRIITQKRDTLTDAEVSRLKSIIGDQTLNACDEGIVQSLAMIGAEAQIQEEVLSVSPYAAYASPALDVKKWSEDTIANGDNNFTCGITGTKPDYFAAARPNIVALFSLPYMPK